MSRLLEDFGHEVLVANARRLRFIYDSDDKGDRVDAEALARVARLDPGLLKPIRHRGEEAQQHLAVVRARDACAFSKRCRRLSLNFVALRGRHVAAQAASDSGGSSFVLR